MNQPRPIAIDNPLRAVWNAILFWTVGEWALQPLVFAGGAMLVKAWHLPDGLTAANISLGELETLAIALGLTALFGFFEGRRPDEYGLPIRQAFRGQFWEGFAIGVCWAASVAVLMIAFGGMHVRGLALHGWTLLWMGLAWLGANAIVGLAEEAWFRGYLLRSLGSGIGFWPAASVLSLWFVAEHYFFKPRENVWDCISIFAFGMLICFTVLRTGSLWFGVGLHAAFDYMQLFVIGTPNGSQVPVDHLLDTSFAGPAWITGGSLGTEASFFMYPLFVAVFVYVALRFPTMTRTARA